MCSRSLFRSPLPNRYALLASLNQHGTVLQMKLEDRPRASELCHVLWCGVL